MVCFISFPKLNSIKLLGNITDIFHFLNSNPDVPRGSKSDLSKE